MVSLYIANTDNDWFDFLSSQTDVSEVNFWQPGGKAFHAIQPGELFAFRLKSPRDKIGGFGVLSSSSILPLQIAWETFRESNGVPSYDALRTAIARYKPDENVGTYDKYRLPNSCGAYFLSPASLDGFAGFVVKTHYGWEAVLHGRGRWLPLVESAARPFAGLVRANGSGIYGTRCSLR